MEIQMRLHKGIGSKKWGTYRLLRLARAFLVGLIVDRIYIYRRTLALISWDTLNENSKCNFIKKLAKKIGNLQVTKTSETCQGISVDTADLVVGQIQLFQSLQFHKRTFTNPTQLIVG